MAMQDLNDLYYYVQVVDHGGFAPAGRALGIPKSKLSRRIALLEERLGVRLLQRTTRRFSVTDVGQTYYDHCKAMMIRKEMANTLMMSPPDFHVTPAAVADTASRCTSPPASRPRGRY